MWFAERIFNFILLGVIIFFVVLCFILMGKNGEMGFTCNNTFLLLSAIIGIVNSICLFVFTLMD